MFDRQTLFAGLLAVPVFGLILYLSYWVAIASGPFVGGMMAAITFLSLTALFACIMTIATKIMDRFYD